MASPHTYLNGLNLAGTVFANGPETLQRAGATFFSGGIQWLDTISGNNANAGSLPELPVATLAQAVTNSAANGIIVIGAGSSESLGASQSLALAGLSIFGCGTGSSRPRYTCTGTVDLLSVAATGVWIENIYFPASTAVATSRIKASNDGFVVKDCYFECGANDTNRAVSFFGGNFCRAEGCSFVVTASRPATGLEVVNSVTDTTIVDCVFDGGSYGWTSYALKVSNGATRIRILGGTYINRSDIGFTATGSSYQLFGIDTAGTGNVELTS